MAGSASASSTSATSINAPGGSITKNSPGVIVAVVIGIVILAFAWLRRKK